MFTQTEELMKFQFMSMSLSYFSSLNMLQQLREMNADTTTAAVHLSGVPTHGIDLSNSAVGCFESGGDSCRARTLVGVLESHGTRALECVGTIDRSNRAGNDRVPKSIVQTESRPRANVSQVSSSADAAAAAAAAATAANVPSIKHLKLGAEDVMQATVRKKQARARDVRRRGNSTFGFLRVGETSLRLWTLESVLELCT